MTTASIAPVADALLRSAIATGERLVARATAHGLAFALSELHDIQIPEPLTARIDQAQLRALATLYLAADLEQAGIIAAVETLAGFSSTGAVSVDLGGAEPLIAEWWRGRRNRVTASERNALFSRVFGTPTGSSPAETAANPHFEGLMLELCEALYKLDERSTGDPYGGGAQQARVRRAARMLTANLGEAAGGTTAFMAGEIIAALQQAIAIIGHPDLRGVFAARDVWGVVAGIARLARVRVPPPTPYVRRGRAGMTVIAWLADVSDRLGGPGGPLVAIGHAVVGSAVDWIEATLDMGLTSASGGPDAPAVPGSPWSVVGA